MLMFRNALNVMLLLPRARLTTSTFASLPQRTIITDSTVASSCYFLNQTPLIGVQEQSDEAVSPRFKNRKTQAAYDRLLQIVHCEEGDDPDFPLPPTMRILVSPLDRTVTYVWDFSFESFFVKVYVPNDDYLKNSEESSCVHLLVYNRLFGIGNYELGFAIRAFDRKIIIDNVSFAGKESDDRHVAFNFSKEFNRNSQAAVYRYLDARRVKPSLYYEKGHLLRLYNKSIPYDKEIMEEEVVPLCYDGTFQAGGAKLNGRCMMCGGLGKHGERPTRHAQQ